MLKAAALEKLSDDELLRRLSSLVSASRRAEAELVAHIAELDARRLFAREAMPSMFQYCIDRLHLSEAEAYLRIAAARASRNHPVLLEMLGDGRLHLTAVSLLAKHLTAENRDSVLARATHKTKREVEELIASLAPKPDVPTRIRKLPKRREAVSKPAAERAPAAPSPPAPVASKPAPRRVEPLSPARYKVQFTADAQLKEKLEKLQALRPGLDLAELIDNAVTEKLARIEARKFGTTRTPRTSIEDVDVSPGSRNIAAAIRRFVDARDGRQCTFTSKDGRRCPTRANLEYHHDEPHGMGGGRGPGNIRLVCRAHNLYLAERDYGKKKMAEYRRETDGADRIGETVPGFELCPDKVGRFAAGELVEPSVITARRRRLTAPKNAVRDSATASGA